MATQTPRLGLTKPEGTDLYDLNVHNGNLDKIDAAIETVEASVDTKLTGYLTEQETYDAIDEKIAAGGGEAPDLSACETVVGSTEKMNAAVASAKAYTDTEIANNPRPPGANGAPGAAATVTVGTVTTGAAGSSASVTNAGTQNAAILNFVIPKGGTGATGATGGKGGTGAKGTSFWGWNTADTMTNISQISGMAVGDYVVNTGTATRTILGTSATAGTDSGSLTSGMTGSSVVIGTFIASASSNTSYPMNTVDLGFRPTAVIAMRYDYRGATYATLDLFSVVGSAFSSSGGSWTMVSGTSTPPVTIISVNPTATGFQHRLSNGYSYGFIAFR